MTKNTINRMKTMRFTRWRKRKVTSRITSKNAKYGGCGKINVKQYIAILLMYAKSHKKQKIRKVRTQSIYLVDKCGIDNSRRNPSYLFDLLDDMPF